MDDLKILVTQAQTGDLKAYTALVRRFQDMAVGYAYSLLGDFHLAEDAAQEAFVGAYQDLPKLREPTAFASWFRRLVAARCSRFTRRKRIAAVPLDAVDEIAAGDDGPDREVERGELVEKVLEAVQTLPEAERTVLTLFYMGEYPQREIGAFLNVPVTTVKNHLRSARGRVRERTMAMVQDELRGKRPSQDEKFTVGVIDDLLRMPDGPMRDLLQVVGGHTDLTMTLQQASQEVREKVYGNLPPDGMERLERDVFFYRPDSDEKPDEARERVLQRASQALDGTLPPARDPQKPSAAVLTLRKKLEPLPFSRMDLEQRVDFFVSLAALIKAEDFLALEQFCVDFDPSSDDIFLEDGQLLIMGLRLVVDYTWPALVNEMLAVRTRTLLHLLETRHQIVVAGVLGVQEGRNSLALGHHLFNHYGFGDTESRQERESLLATRETLGFERFSEFSSPAEYAMAAHQYTHNQMRQRSVRQMAFPELCELFQALTDLARREGIRTLQDLVELVDYDLLRRGLQLAIDSTEPDLIRELLQGRGRNLLRQQEVRYRMICVGVEAIQAREEPEVVSERIRCLYEV